MSGHMEYHLEAMDLERVAGDVIKLLNIQAEGKSLSRL